MKKAMVGVLFVMMSFGFALPGLAAALDVPQSYPTIQSAIDAASWGDTVRVAPGEYVQR